MFKKSICLVAALLLATPPAFATWPVIDFSNLAQLRTHLAEARKRLGEMKDSKRILDEAKHLSEGQLGELKKEVEAITGNYEMGTKGYKDYANFLGVGSWQDALSSYKGGGNRLSSIASQINQTLSIGADKFSGNVPNDKTNQYNKLMAETVVASRATSQLMIDEVETRVESQDTLVKKIDTTKNLKDSIELLSRMQAESNQIQLQTLRMLAMLNQQNALKDQGLLEATANQASFFKLPN